MVYSSTVFVVSDGDLATICIRAIRGQFRTETVASPQTSLCREHAINYHERFPPGPLFAMYNAPDIRSRKSTLHK